MAEQKSVTITAGGKERVRQSAALHEKCFKDDPVMRYFLSHMSEEQRNAYLFKLFTRFFTAAAMNGAVFEDADNFSASTVLLPPGKKLDNPLTILQSGLVALILDVGVKAGYRMAVEYGRKVDACKKKALKGAKKYWYVFFIGTDPVCQGRGLGGKLILEVLKRAQADNVPAWIEASSPGSYRLYLRQGFKLVEEIRLGKGVADANGRPKKGEEGVPVWTLAWWPSKGDSTGKDEPFTA